MRKKTYEYSYIAKSVLVTIADVWIICLHIYLIKVSNQILQTKLVDKGTSYVFELVTVKWPHMSV